MIRRQVLSAISIPGVFLLSGCINSTNQQRLPDEGAFWIANYTDTDQMVEVLIVDEADNTVFSERYELAPDATEDGIVSEWGVGEVENTYYVEVTTNDHEEEFEWELDQNKNHLNIRIEDSEVQFERSAPEEG